MPNIVLDDEARNSLISNIYLPYNLLGKIIIYSLCSVLQKGKYRIRLKEIADREEGKIVMESVILR